MNTRKLVLPRWTLPCADSDRGRVGGDGVAIPATGHTDSTRAADQGYIGVYISDPVASVDFSISPSSGSRVALGEDARFPPRDQVSGTMPGVEARGEPTYFVNDVEWPTRADPDEHGAGTVSFGNQPGGGYFQISFLTVKVAEPRFRASESTSQPRALESRELSTSTIDTVTAPNGHWGPPEVPRRSGAALGGDGACIAVSDEDIRTGDVPDALRQR
jgi:hypothetical protein